MKLSAQSKIGVGVLAAIMVIGFCAYLFQLTQGLCVTGMSNGVSWGLYITCFMFFVGLSAGGLIVASSAHVFGIESFKRVSMPAVITSTVCILCAGAFILIDLGGIQRIWNMFIHLNFTSPLAWDMCVITTYLVINVLDIIWLRRGDERKVKMLSYVALPVAILVHSVTAWIFGLEIAKEGWYSAIMAPIFVASACDSGLALLMVVLAAVRKAGVFDCGRDLFANLARLLATFIAVDAFFIGCELLTTAYPGTEGASHVLGIMTSGATAPFFWFEILGGLLIHLINFWSKMQLVEIMGGHVNSLGYSPADGAALIQYTFSQWYYVVIYLLWFAALWFHLTHGVWSMFQSVGWANDTWYPRLKGLATVVASIVFLGFAAVVVVYFVQSICPCSAGVC